MQDIFRYHISGMMFIFWTSVFLSPYINYSYILSLMSAENINIFNALFAIAGALVATSSPIGILIHTLSMTLHSVPRFSKLAQWAPIKNRVLSCCKQLAHDGKYFADAEHTLSKAVLPKEYDIPYIRDAISNLYAYCYLRIDAGIFSPILGILASKLILLYSLQLPVRIVVLEPLFPITYPIIFAVLICLLLVAYLPRMLLEIAELETFLIRNLNRSELFPKIHP
ncbi:MAG: hypothetical protein LBV79_10625 [Candidatus Adiutrix sp.]|jgi:hypothetical protein|nr:hypothetical protein [Candidatus Adiutrix sp.]